ncbi:reverse transcriptase domain-containing protein [Tanacetum coccineum]
MLDQYRKEMHEQFSQILSTIGKSETPKPEAPTFSITTRSGVSTRDPLFPTPSKPTLSEEAEKDDEDERLLSIFKQIHINLPFLEVMIHMPKEAKECSASSKGIAPKRREPRKLHTRGHVYYRTSAVKNCLGVDFIVLEMDEVELVPIILRRPFLATTRAVIDVHEGKLSLRVGSKTVTFNIRKSMKSKHSQDDYLYCANHTAKLVQEQWVDTVDHDKKWTEVEVEEDSNKVQAVSFYPRIELVEPLEWKSPENWKTTNSQWSSAPHYLPSRKPGSSRFYRILKGQSPGIPIALEDHEKTTFTYPYGTFAYKRMPFGLCNAPATFQRCMIAIFHEPIKESMEVFMDDFSVFGNSFNHCLKNLEKMLKRCEEINLVLNWEKYHFMVKE